MDSLVIGESLELIGSVPSTNPACTGAIFLLQPGYDLGAPQPVTSIIGSLLLDGSRPFGYQAGNRTISLPVEIQAPDFQTLTGAREVLLREINQQTWTLRWTRDPGAGTALPLLFDCFRAHATVVQWGNVDSLNRFPIGLLTLSFEAMPYGRTDVPVVVDFPSPLSGRTAPPAAVNVDTFSSVAGTQWAASAQSPGAGGQSAFWDPGIAPGNHPDGTGLAATYTKAGLALNLAAGWSATCNVNGGFGFITVSNADAAKTAVGDQFQLWNTGVLLQTQIFTVTGLSPAGANTSVVYTPNASSSNVIGNVAIQTGPPHLPALTLWAGFGSTGFYQHWARLGGRVTFAVTLTDTYGTTAGFSRTVKVTGSNATGSPRWNKVRIPVPYKPGFDYANVASYSVTVTNRGTGDLRYTQLYLSALMAVPPPVVVAPSPQRGTVYELSGLPGSARAPVSLQFQQAGTKTYTQTLSVAGSGNWVCPPGVSTVSAFCIGGGGNGQAGANGGGGGGAGGTAANAAVAVTPGTSYTFFVGGAGFGIGASGHLTTFNGDSVSVTANGGAGTTTSTGGAGGAAGTGGFAGGAGGNGTNTTAGGGGGGGSSGGTAGAGNAGSAAAGGTGGAGGAAVAGGGNGGRGGTKNVGNGLSPTTGYGGGGGGSPGGASGGTYAGRSGVITLTYTSSLPGFQTLLVHRPPVTAPDSLLPFVSPSVSDLADGNTQYPVASLVPGTNARFAGTYTVVLSAWAWHTTTVRTLTVTVTQWEQPGGASYSSSVAASITPSTLPVCSGTNANFGPLVVIGELTLPVQDLPQDNKNAYFTVSVTSSDTADQFQDVLFLDSMGSTVLIQSPTAYANMGIDAPPNDRDIGLPWGSLYDRDDAVSILDRAIVAGGPMSVEPDGNPHLLAYCAEGTPGMQMTFHPAWWLDRQS